MYSSLPDYANAEVMVHQHQQKHQQFQHQQQQKQQHQQQYHFQHQPPSQQRHHKQPVVASSSRQSPTASITSSTGDGGSCGSGGELDERAGRFASALLLLAALVLTVDATRVGLYSWYSEGTYLHFAYGDGQTVTWARCGAPLQAASQPPAVAAEVAVERAIVQSPQGQTGSSTSTNDGKGGSGGGRDESGWLVVAKQSVMDSVLLTGEVLNAGFIRPSPRAPPKPLAIGLGHASPAACICLLLTAALPACLRSARPSRCALTVAVWLTVSSIALAALAVSACIVKIYFFTLCEIAPPGRALPAPQFNYDTLVPPCPLMRKAFFCAECFSLLVLIAAASMSVCLLAFYSRALCYHAGAGAPTTAAAAAAATDANRRRRYYDNNHGYYGRDECRNGEESYPV